MKVNYTVQSVTTTSTVNNSTESVTFAPEAASPMTNNGQPVYRTSQFPSFTIPMIENDTGVFKAGAKVTLTLEPTSE